MENVVLIVHLILALLLIGAVLLQRSEGGALGIGGGGGNVMSGRSAATALQKATWGLAAAFVVTSMILTVFATQKARDDDLLDTLLLPVPIESEDAPVNVDSLLPPTIELETPSGSNAPSGQTGPAAGPSPAPAPADTGGATTDELIPPSVPTDPILPDLGGQQ